MKKVFFMFVLFSSLLISCSKSEEDKVAELLKQEIQNNLYFPESYEPVKTTVDTLATPFDNSETIKQVSKLVSLRNEAESLENTVKEKKRRYEELKAIGLPYGHYKTEMEEYQEAQSDLNEVLAKMEKQQEKVDKILSQERVFAGFAVEHSFRAKNNAGDVLMGNYFLVLNKEKDKILYYMDATDTDLRNFISYMNELNEE